MIDPKIRAAAAALESSTPRLVHVFQFDGKTFRTFAEVEDYVERNTRSLCGYAVVFSCAAIDVAGEARPLATAAFAVVHRGGDPVWTLAPPGATLPVFNSGGFAGWVMGDG